MSEFQSQMISNDDAEGRMRRTSERLAGLHDVTEALSGSLTPEQVAEAVVRHGVRVLGAQAGSLALLTEAGDELELVRTIGYTEAQVQPYQRFRLDAPLPLADAARTGQPVYLEQWEQWVARYPHARDEPPREDRDDSWAAIPLLGETGAVGGIGLTFAGARAFDVEDKAFMVALARQCAQALERARLYAEAHRARATAEIAGGRMALLAEASAALAASLDYQTTLTRLATLSVPRLADWCAVDVLGEDGSVERLAVAHVDPAKVEWARELRRRYHGDPDRGVAQVIRTGQAEFYPDVTDAQLAASARDGEHLALLRQIGFRSVIMVPLNARGKTLGALILVTSDESGRRFDTADLSFAEDLAQRAALAVDNARLYQNAREAERHKDAMLAELEAMLVGSPTGFAYMDTDFRYVRVNEPLARLNGLSVEAHIGAFAWDVIGEKAWGHRKGLFERALAGEATQNVDLSLNPPQYAGGERHIMASYYPVRVDGKVVGIGVAVNDVTERRRAEEALIENEVRQRTLLRDVLVSVTEGKFRLCENPADLPPRLDPTGDVVTLSPQVVRAIRAATREAALSQGLSEERLQDLETAVGEAAMNAVVHGGGGVGDVRAGHGVVQVWIQDAGGGIDVQRLPRATLQRGFTTTGTLGHGFWMMLQTADTLWLLTGPTGTTVVIEQYKKAPEPAWLQLISEAV